ncbi:DUF1857-domain-containing protein [Punctularia strigosozonata HHB-11173 SS5]|uniref:DUF1857-domain-containing protein n=1 Tax=Punctularia strigosozonata (strain HHB-11173) TaxID=741275 RepID=R7S2T0_PUNST|nr:DUF1857-domain-containing protein [Punctularia strigosozonata HHB-11173 SS5]EIN04154.1 DUF1857-domain-containing protein [Punctularia strigosozonata HHB-11173 SS5]
MVSALAATVPVNPPGATPVLSEAQVWEGLGIKARNPKSFVAAITHCELVYDSPNKVTRRVKFGEDAPLATEEIELHEPAIAYFEVSLGNRITNIVSYSPSGELLLTFSFANGIPGVPTDEATPNVQIAKGLAGGIQHSIDRIRELVVDGTIKAK